MDWLLNTIWMYFPLGTENDASFKPIIKQQTAATLFLGVVKRIRAALIMAEFLFVV